MKDAFDQWWEWANKPFSDMATISAEIHEPVCRPKIATTARRSTKPCAVSMQSAPRLSEYTIQTPRGGARPIRAARRMNCERSE